MPPMKKISLIPGQDYRRMAADGVFGTATAVGLIVVAEKVNEIIEHLTPKEKWPMEEGEREMWAVLGSAGGIYGFASSAHKAEEMRDRHWNIGRKAPERYFVKFRRAKYEVEP